MLRLQIATRDAVRTLQAEISGTIILPQAMKTRSTSSMAMFGCQTRV